MIFVLRDEKKNYENNYSLFNVQNENFVIISIKKQEKVEGLVIGIYNSMKVKSTEGKFLINKKYKKLIMQFLMKVIVSVYILKIVEVFLSLIL